MQRESRASRGARGARLPRAPRGRRATQAYAGRRLIDSKTGRDWEIVF